MDRNTLERKLRIRSWRRGTREMDLLLGRFADTHLAGLAASEIRAYEALLDRGDPEISDIVLGLCPAGEHALIAARIRMHHGILVPGSRSTPASADPPVRAGGRET